MKEVIIAILIVGFLLISIAIILDEIKEQETEKAELEEKKRQEVENNKIKKIEDILNSLNPFMKSFKGVASTAVIHYYDSRSIFGDYCRVDDTCVEIHYKYKNYSDSFILFFSDMDTMKREINNHFAKTVKDYDNFEYNRILLENVKSERLEADATSIYTETITGKIIYRNGTNIKDITKFISGKFTDVTNFKFYEESINLNKFNIGGFKEREFEIERRII